MAKKSGIINSLFKSNFSHHPLPILPIHLLFSNHPNPFSLYLSFFFSLNPPCRRLSGKSKQKKEEEEEDEEEVEHIDAIAHHEGEEAEEDQGGHATMEDDDEAAADHESTAQLTAVDEAGASASNANGNNAAVMIAAPSAQNVDHYSQQAALTEYRDITDLLNLPQIEAAKKLDMPMSTLSKRWKEAVRFRKWPYRQVAKLDKEIMTLLHNIPSRTEGNDSNVPPTPPEIEQALGVLLRRRQEELRPVRIRMCARPVPVARDQQA